jgi:hypothetical protein
MVRYVWASPASVIGLLLATVTGSMRGASLVAGVIEIHGPGLRWFLTHGTFVRGVSAITFGHVVLACGARELEGTRIHERVHVRQYEQWGFFFIPAYLLASLWAAATGRHAYYDNYFEREAYGATEASPRLSV